MATLPEGALMQRAAAGLASAVLDLLGRAYGSTVVLLVGAGDNGGDALYAGALLARRGVPGDRVVAVRHPARGRPRGAAPRRRPVHHRGAPPRRRTSSSTASSASADDRGCGPRRRQALRALAGVPVVAVDVPSGVDVDTGELDGPARAGRRHGHLRHATRSRCWPTRPPARRRGPPRRHRAGPPGGRPSRASRPPTSRPCCRGPTRRRRSTPAAWSASAPGR